jgi:tetratricopeptide (TPR) repeat protein
MNVIKDLNKRGFVYYSYRKFSEAISCFSQAIRVSPMHSIAYFNRGETWFAMKNYEKARVDYTK